MERPSTRIKTEAKAILRRLVGGDTLLHASPYRSDLPSYFFGESDSDDSPEPVSPDVVKELIDQELASFPPFSESTKYRAVAATLTSEGRQVGTEN